MKNKHKALNIAPHHFTRQQMTPSIISKMRLRIPTTRDAIIALGGIPDETFCDRGFFFHLPNRTVDQVRVDLESLTLNGQTRDPRHEANRLRLEEEEARRHAAQFRRQEEEIRLYDEQIFRREEEAQRQREADFRLQEEEICRLFEEQQLCEEEKINRQREVALAVEANYRLLQRKSNEDAQAARQKGEEAVAETEEILGNLAAEEAANLDSTVEVLGAAERSVRSFLHQASSDELYQLHCERDKYKEENERLKAELEELKKKSSQLAKSLNKIKRRENRTRDVVNSMLSKVDCALGASLGAGCGGLSRSAILSRQYHIQNPGAANTLFGFATLNEFKVYVTALMPDIDVNDVPVLHAVQDGSTKEINVELTPERLSPFEQCAAAMIFMRAIPVRSIIASIFGVSEARIGQMLVQWLRRWGKVGEYLSILPMPPDYFEKECPNEYLDCYLKRVAALVDGKDFMIEVKRQDERMRRTQYSNKVGHAAGRGITWTTPMGLTFEHTAMYGGRADERTLVENHGRLGPRVAPIADWKDWARCPENRKKADEAIYLATSIDEVRTDWGNAAYENFEEANVEEDNAAGNGVTDALADDSVNEEDHGVLGLNGMDDRNENNGLNGNDDRNDNRVAKTLAGFRSLCNDIDGFHQYMIDHEHQQDQLSVMTDRKQARKEATTIDSVDALKEELKESVENSPQSKPEEFLCQLELHQRLHLLYESGRLKKTALAFYLLATKEYRLDILHWMGSEMAEIHIPSYGNDGQPEDVPLRLNKIPRGKEMLADKGFVQTKRFYPNANKQRTPLVLRGRKVWQYTNNKINGKYGKRPVCRLRYTSEWCFSQMTILNALKDVIPYSNIWVLPYIYEWGHAMINLAHHPHRLPGRNSGINTETYFDMAVNQNKNSKRRKLNHN